MTASWLRATAEGSELVPLPLPYKQFATDGTPDDTEARRRLAAEGADRPLHASSVFETSGPLCSASLGAGTVLPQPGARSLNIVLSGSLELDVAGSHASLGHGATLFVDGVEAGPVRAGAHGVDVLQLDVGTWQPSGVLPAEVRSNAAGVTIEPRARRNFKRIYKASDDRSYFREFPELLPAPGSGVSSAREIVGLWFASIPKGFFIDWHPEIVNQLVVVLKGEISIESGGGAGQTEHFKLGDVLLAEDRTGEGHVDRVLSDLHVMVLVIADDQLWPVTTDAPDSAVADP